MPLKLLRATQSWPGHKVIFLMWCLSIWGGGQKHGEGLRKISREMRIRKECGKTETIGLTQVGLQAEDKLLQLVVIYT